MLCDLVMHPSQGAELHVATSPASQIKLARCYLLRNARSLELAGRERKKNVLAIFVMSASRLACTTGGYVVLKPTHLAINIPNHADIYRVITVSAVRRPSRNTRGT